MKVKCLIMAIFIALSGLVVNAASDTSVDLDHEKHISLLSQLNINEGISKASDENITRAEFTAMVVRAINAGNIGTSDEYFTDCNNNAFKREIYIAKAMGITNGTSETTFSPDEGVPVSVAAKMLITALGYGDLAEAKGGYPTGYLSLASSLDIFDGVTQSEALTVKNAYSLIYNTMITETPIITGVSDDELVIETVENRNLLTEKFHLTHISGIVMSAGGYSLVPELAEKGKVYVSGTMLNTDIDLSRYFGLDVDIWYDNSDTVKVILETYSNNTVIVEAENVVNYNNNVLSAFNGKDKEIKYSLEPGFSFVQNGRVEAHTAGSFNFDEGMLTLVDNDGNGKYEVVLVKKPKYFIISSLNNENKTIYDKYSDYGSISFEDDVNKFYSIEVNGEPADFSALSKGMVCEVYMSTDLGVCLLKANENFSVEGTLEEICDDEVCVNGSTYKLNSYFRTKGVELKAGATYKFLIAPDSTIASISIATDSEIQYAYMLGYSDEQVALDDSPMIKLLTTNNDIEVYKLDKRIVFNGKKINSTDNAITNKLKDGENPIYQLVKYTSKDGIITMIDTESISSLENWDPNRIDDVNDSLIKYVSQKSVRFSEDSSFGIPNVSFERAVTFFVPKDLGQGKKYNDDLFVCTDYSMYLRGATLYKVDAFDYDASYCPGAVIVYYTDEDTSSLVSSLSSRSSSYIVRDVNDAVDNDGNIIKVLKVYGNGRYRDYPISIDIYNELLKEQEANQIKAVPTRGDIIRISTDFNGYINGIAVDVVYDSINKSASINYGKKGVYSTGNELLTYFSGRVLSLGGNYMLINAVTVPSDSVWEDGKVNLKLSSSPKVVVCNTKTGLIKAGTIDDIVAGLDKNDPNASFVVVRTSYYIGSTIFIYEN